MHRDSITAAWLLPRATSPEVRTIPHEVKPFRRLVRQLLAHGPARACYEAGPLGYAPQRQLTAWGPASGGMIAPSLTPRRPGQRIKTDTRDAKKLVGLYRAGELTCIRIPTPAEEAARELVRCREAAVGEARRAQQRLRHCLHVVRCYSLPLVDAEWKSSAGRASTGPPLRIRPPLFKL